MTEDLGQAAEDGSANEKSPGEIHAVPLDIRRFVCSAQRDPTKAALIQGALANIRFLIEERKGPVTQGESWRLVAGHGDDWDKESIETYRQLLGAAFPNVTVDMQPDHAAIVRYADVWPDDEIRPDGLRICVINCGGRSTTVSALLLHKVNGIAQVSDASHYHDDIGGNDFDLALAVLFRDQIGGTIDTGKLVPQISPWKEMLCTNIRSGASHASVSWHLSIATGHRREFVRLNLDRPTFESATEGVVRRIRQLLKRAREDRIFQIQRPDRVVLAGGSARCFLVEELVKAEVPRAIVENSGDPANLCCFGLAIQPVRPTARQKSPPPEKPVVEEARIEIRQGPHRGTYPVENRVTIGRSDLNDIILGDPTVSRHHAMIVRTGDGRFVLTDTKSQHGTLVNGKRRAESELKAGDQIRIGPDLLHFLIDRRP
jgi:FHA domain-containing protein/Hsp70 protein